MPDTYCRRLLHSLAIFFVLLSQAACSTLQDGGRLFAKSVTPYRIDIIQGNVVTREQFATLKTGMRRAQVRDALGTSLLASLFHADRWDYVFTLNRPGIESQARRVTVFFKNDLLERIESDELPSEADFVSSLKSKPLSGSIPLLEASAESLSRFPVTKAASAEPPVAVAAPVNYPPLESSAQQP